MRYITLIIIFIWLAVYLQNTDMNFFKKKKEKNQQEQEQILIEFNDSSRKKIIVDKGHTYLWQWAEWKILIHNDTAIAANVKSFKKEYATINK